MTRYTPATSWTALDRAVSPVIGVILMVAITVVLAAAIGVLVLDMAGTAAEAPPQASLAVSLDRGGDFVNVSHRGGDGIDAGRTRVVIADATDGDQVSFGPAADPDVLVVGDEVSFDVADSSVASTTWSGMGDGSGSIDVDAGDRYSLQLIDTAGQRVVFEVTLTA